MLREGPSSASASASLLFDAPSPPRAPPEGRGGRGVSGSAPPEPRPRARDRPDVAAGVARMAVGRNVERLVAQRVGLRPRRIARCCRRLAELAAAGESSADLSRARDLSAECTAAAAEPGEAVRGSTTTTVERAARGLAAELLPTLRELLRSGGVAVATTAGADDAELDLELSRFFAELPAATADEVRPTANEAPIVPMVEKERCVAFATQE